MRLSERRQSQDKTMLMKNWTTLPGLLSPSTQPEGENFVSSPISQQERCIPFKFVVFFFFFLNLPQNSPSLGKTKDSIHLAGYTQQYCHFH